MRTRHPVVGLALAALAALVLTGRPVLAQSGCIGFAVASLESPKAKSVPTFSVTTTSDLLLTAVLDASTKGDHVLEIKVITPDGGLYRSITVPITDPGRAAKAQSLKGFPHALLTKPMIWTVIGRRKALAVTVPFPVGGTDIVSNGIYGTWKLKASLDGAPSTCATASSFSLKE